jgi:hypothetical protein
MAFASLNDPRHWQKRRDEMRAIAEDVKDPETRATLLRLAADYEKLAERAAERAGGIPANEPEKAGAESATEEH